MEGGKGRAFTAVSGKPFIEGKLHKHLCLPGIDLNPFAPEKGVAVGWISLL